jgi:limonene-1,2-epoxide hydrolase
MRAVRTPLLAAVLVFAGCGGSSASPESVVRAWSEALNSGDNNRAGSLFAPGARIVQAGIVERLRSRAEAVAWNASLPCSGRIVALRARGETVRASFLLGDRPANTCDGPGSVVRALFRVHDGKIVLWHQLPGPPTREGPVV